MAHIGVSVEEMEKWSPQIGSVVEWFGELRAADLEGVPPALRGSYNADVTREDNAVNFERREEMLSMFPETEGAFVRVPRMTNEAED
eukprot:CAMPEP_0177577972 /NCGR_PEP_ID=MMETSP0419_2-20121207/73_1 /TAXON_ID=582737 /ORGANISM="Tetraselmis sp., Strain GSL018" /LENGTH=86 /DNA_ID=CAMNT_0019066331 /DNA_START=295 /DNA_END=555 /DNA_ORIENTATION=-